MGYKQWWETLEELVAQLRKKKVEILPELIADLRSAKTLINIHSADPSFPEPIQKIETSLLDLESRLIEKATSELGRESTESWIRKLDEARRMKDSETSVKKPSFIGVPKGSHWLRILPSDEELKTQTIKLATDLGLSYKPQADGYIMIYGEKARVKDFVKKMAEKCRKPRAD